MSGQNDLSSAPKSSISELDSSQQLFQNYRASQDALTLSKQLVQMIRAVQRHRGMSLAILGGNQDFQEPIAGLQRQLKVRLLGLKAFSEGTGLLSEQTLDELNRAWVTISHNWQEDSVLDNYELHCHLLEQLLAILGGLSRRLETPLLPARETDVQSKEADPQPDNRPSRLQTLELLHFSTRLLPSVVEQIGRIRALASYAAALGRCGTQEEAKLRYVIQNTRVNNEKLRHQLSRLDTILPNDLCQTGSLKRYELKVAFLLNMVEQDLLEAQPMTADSNRLFAIATDIIDVYLQVAQNGLTRLGQWLEQDLEHWLDGG